MSGHSKWSTIKHQKEAKDQKRGIVFTKLGRAIAVAVRQGGSTDPETNFGLRLAVERAKGANMPKDNIQKAIERGSGKEEGSGLSLKEVAYEGFGPQKVAIVVETLTDNSNRTVSELKKIFDRGGGSLSSPGSVAYLFDKAGMLFLDKEVQAEEMMLKLIDLGAEDVEEVENGIKVYTQAEKLAQFKNKLVEAGFKVRTMEIVMKPKVLVEIKEEKVSQKIISLLAALNAHDDVQKTWVNFVLQTDG